MDKLGKRIKLCGFQETDGVLMVKYKDEDGDLVSMRSNEDVQMAFEITQKYGKAVELHVAPKMDDRLSSYARQT